MQESHGSPPPQRAPMQWYPAPAIPPAPDTGRGQGLAITAVVLSAVALLGVLALAFFVVVTSGPTDENASAGPLTGQLPTSAAGGRVTGDALAEVVSARITQDGRFNLEPL
jgi:hypothetical protein